MLLMCDDRVNERQRKSVSPCIDDPMWAWMLQKINQIETNEIQEHLRCLFQELISSTEVAEARIDELLEKLSLIPADDDATCNAAAEVERQLAAVRELRLIGKLY